MPRERIRPWEQSGLKGHSALRGQYYFTPLQFIAELAE